MRKKVVWLLFSLGLVLVLQGAAQTAPTETQPQVQAPSALTKPAQPACPPPCLTTEQEAALVEVRKILQEARQVVEGIETSGGLFTSEKKLGILREYKDGLIRKIEKAQFQAGDLGTAATTKQPWYLALAQVKYGRVQEAIQTAAQDHYGSKGALDTLLVLMDALIRVGAMQAAITVAETDVAKEGVYSWNHLAYATVLSFIARRQFEAGEPQAQVTLQRAVQEAQATGYPPDRLYALIHVARAQATMGDRTASAATFRQAIQAALAIKRDGTPEGALSAIALAQAQSGDQAGSGQTFQEAIGLISKKDPQAKAFGLVRVACGQVANGQRTAGLQTFQQALEIAESLPAKEKGRVLREIGEWQLKAGEREALAETLERARKAGVDVIGLAGQAGYLKLALGLAGTISDVGTQSGALGFVARRLVETKDPFGTPEVFQQLSQTATALLKEPVPKDKLTANFMLMNIALVQASANELPTALRTIEMISSESILLSYAYPSLIQLLTRQGKLADARQVAAGLKENWIFGGTSEANNRDALRELAKLGVRSGDVQGTLAWARKQLSPLAQGYALLGVAEALMEQNGIEDFDKLRPEIPWRGMWPCGEKST
jgi:hypothetical protein